MSQSFLNQIFLLLTLQTTAVFYSWDVVGIFKSATATTLDYTTFQRQNTSNAVADEVFYLEKGETLIMPKDIPHAVYGEEKFKMQLVVSYQE